jgi:cytochrome c biogenesis protein CcmG/thiol:disulfide interchange protein DsbE
MEKKPRLGPLIALGAAGFFIWMLVSTYNVPDSRPLTPAARRTPVPAINLTDLNGNPWNLDGQRGSVVLVNFWASWCPPCREETPGLVRLANDYRGKGVAVAGISLDEGGAPAARRFVREFEVSYPILLPDPAFGMANSIQSLPTTFLIDRHGRLAKTYIGAVSRRTFEKDIQELLREQG